MTTPDPGPFTRRAATDVPPPTVDRSVAAVLLAVRARAGGGAFVRGRWGTGVTHVLTHVADRARREYEVVSTVADGDDGTIRRWLDARDGSASSRTEPLLVVDDAYRLSDGAANDLRDAVMNRRARAVLGTRRHAPLPPPLHWMVTAHLLTPVDVEPLTLAQTTDVIASHTGGRVHSGTVYRIHVLAAGRAAFVADLVRAGLRAGSLSHRNGLWRTSGDVCMDDVADRLTLELRQMEPVLAAALRTLGWAGPLPDVVAESVIGRGELDRLIGLGYVERPAENDAVVTIVPGAVPAVIRREQPPRTVAALARRLLDLVGTDGANEVASWPDLVRWRLAAGEVPADDDLHAAALSLWDDGDTYGALTTVRAGRSSPALVRLEADLLAETGRRREAIEALERLADADDPVVRETAVTELATIKMWLGERERALAISAGSAERSDATALSRVGHALVTLEAGEPAVAERLAGQLVDSDPAVAAPALAIRATAHALMGSTASAVSEATQALALASDPAPETDVPTVALVLALCEGGNLIDAHETARAGYEASLRAGRHAQGWMALCRLRVSLYRGDLDLADTFGLEAAETFADLDQRWALRWAIAGQILAASARWDVAAVAELASSLSALDETGVRFLEPDVWRAKAWVRAVAGDAPGARELLLHAADVATRADSVSLAGAAWHDLVRLGAADEAADPLAEIARTSDSVWGPPRAGHCRAVVDGDGPGALRAAELFNSMGAALYAQEAAADAGRLAAEHRDWATVRAANAARRSWPCPPGARTPPLLEANAVELTGREREVAHRAASGSSNRAIAESLGVSVRTVENLLHRSYQKLGVRRRIELAEALAPQRRERDPT